MNQIQEQLARAAYEGYCMAYADENLPWEKLPKPCQEGWHAASVNVIYEWEKDNGVYAQLASLLGAKDEA